jgi:hypothetical protein
MVDYVVSVRLEQHTLSAIYGKLDDDGKQFCKPLVVALMKLGRSSNGRTLEGLKTAILCSNPKISPNGTTSGTENELPGKVPDSDKQLPGSTPEASTKLQEALQIIQEATSNDSEASPNGPEAWPFLPHPDRTHLGEVLGGYG